MRLRANDTRPGLHVERSTSSRRGRLKKDTSGNRSPGSGFKIRPRVHETGSPDPDPPMSPKSCHETPGSAPYSTQPARADTYPRIKGEPLTRPHTASRTPDPDPTGPAVCFPDPDKEKSRSLPASCFAARDRLSADKQSTFRDPEI